MGQSHVGTAQAVDRDSLQRLGDKGCVNGTDAEGLAVRIYEEPTEVENAVLSEKSGTNSFKNAIETGMGRGRGKLQGHLKDSTLCFR